MTNVLKIKFFGLKCKELWGKEIEADITEMPFPSTVNEFMNQFEKYFKNRDKPDLNKIHNFKKPMSLRVND